MIESNSGLYANEGDNRYNAFEKDIAVVHFFFQVIVIIIIIIIVIIIIIIIIKIIKFL